MVSSRIRERAGPASRIDRLRASTRSVGAWSAVKWPVTAVTTPAKTVERLLW